MATRKITKPNELRGQFEVNIDGKKVLGISSMNALRMFTKSSGYKLDQLDKCMEEDPMGTIAELAYYSCVNKAHRDDTEFNISKEKFVSYFLDDIGQMQEISNAVMSSLSVQTESGEPKK